MATLRREGQFRKLLTVEDVKEYLVDYGSIMALFFIRTLRLKQAEI